MLKLDLRLLSQEMPLKIMDRTMIKVITIKAKVRTTNPEMVKTHNNMDKECIRANRVKMMSKSLEIWSSLEDPRITTNLDKGKKLIPVRLQIMETLTSV